MSKVWRGALVGAAVGATAVAVSAWRRGDESDEIRASAIRGALGGGLIGLGAGFVLDRREAKRLARAARRSGP
ncbi:MAG: hypothetical protein H0U89_01210, partial [Acidimicrobiia bacterium]|nr:hypothetical protein [Acidimicrobiia bacterium]